MGIKEPTWLLIGVSANTDGVKEELTKLPIYSEFWRGERESPTLLKFQM